MQTALTEQTKLKKIRRLILFFIIMLALSGITAFPVESELAWLLQFQKHLPYGLKSWLQRVYGAIKNTNENYPYLAYGYDWLAFAHLVIAGAFYGPYRDPKRNLWVIEWAMAACVAVIPLALIAGPARQIPVFWRWIDCFFGILGIIPLFICRKWIKQLQ
jgi:hypothetical protein